LLAAMIAQPLELLKRLFWVTVLCTGCAIPPLIAVWAVPHTSADLVLLCLFLAGLGLSWVLRRVPQRALAPIAS
jgi:hypothetical protein